MVAIESQLPTASNPIHVRAVDGLHRFRVTGTAPHHAARCPGPVSRLVECPGSADWLLVASCRASIEAIVVCRRRQSRRSRSSGEPVTGSTGQGRGPTAATGSPGRRRPAGARRCRTRRRWAAWHSRIVSLLRSVDSVAGPLGVAADPGDQRRAGQPVLGHAGPLVASADPEDVDGVGPVRAGLLGRRAVRRRARASGGAARPPRAGCCSWWGVLSGSGRYSSS